MLKVNLWEHLHNRYYFETEIRERFPTIVKLYKELNQDEDYSLEMENILKFKSDDI